MLVGVVSDTHGYLDPKVPELLQGVDWILHAGDVGDQAVVSELGRIAPVTVVRGNVDRAGPTSEYPLVATVVIGDSRILLTHEVKVPKGFDDPVMQGYRQAKIDAVVYGHSHIAHQERRGPVLFFNPGAAGKRRFKVVPSIGFLVVETGWIEGSIAPL